MLKYCQKKYPVCLSLQIHKNRRTFKKLTHLLTLIQYIYVFSKRNICFSLSSGIGSENVARAGPVRFQRRYSPGFLSVPFRLWDPAVLGIRAAPPFPAAPHRPGPRPPPSAPAEGLTLARLEAPGLPGRPEGKQAETLKQAGDSFIPR